MSAFERRSVLFLTLLYIFRMLGLFMVLPLLALYAEQYEGATPLLMGLALGVYGLSQALLQIPFGMCSDRWGRKPLIAFGLLLFALGSLLAAYSETIWGLIAGRALQGAGAIAGVIMALVGDVTAERNRSKAMASIGAAIGVAFAISLVLGPVLASWGGLPVLFMVTAALAVVGLLILQLGLPDPPRMKKAAPAAFSEVLGHGALLRLTAAVFTLHFALMALFVAVPGMLMLQLGLQVTAHWQVYLPVMLLAFAFMVPAIIWAERAKRHHAVLRLSAALLFMAGLLLLLVGADLWAGAFALLAGLLLFFIGFNVLEASLPSMLTRLLSMEQRGAASGVYSTGQFVGTFLGGLAGGALLSLYGSSGVFALLVVLAVIIAGVLWQLPALPEFNTLFVDVHADRRHTAPGQLSGLPGVLEVAVSEAGVASIRVDEKDFREELLAALQLDAPMGQQIG
ncbi:MFS transporter [Pseudoteredinibacter isoporae]|nr:MFS transporter [Pseudoteredinibacter isoporae]NHO86411.1 MFS transporter [Pseudoteredinibacter isoporae]NIB25137.1 MFS transporter [Pseudoteredinibacter isoporae]